MPIVSLLLANRITTIQQKNCVKAKKNAGINAVPCAKPGVWNCHMEPVS
jgi:ligand-binding sensor protein